MEAVASIIVKAVMSTGQSLFGFYPSIKAFIIFKSNLRALAEGITSLTDLRDRVIGEVDTSDAHTSEWLQEFEKIRLEVESIQTDLTAKYNKISRKRYRLSQEITRMLKDVKRLMKEGNIAAKMASRNYLAKAVEHIPGPSIENQTTASKNIAKVMDLLKEDDVLRIGVWGMGGVGKTTLAKNLNNMFKDLSSTMPFSIIIWVTVSKTIDLRKVQIQLAERLKLEVKSEESRESLTKRLHYRLQKEKYLLILDDVWDTIELDSLGVPQPEIHTGSKIILTCRSLEVCREMKTDKEVKVDVLNDQESWHLFIANTGKVANFEHIEPIAKAVAKECGGLPLAIIIVGTAMRGKSMIEVWKDALNKLQRSVPYIRGIESKVYNPLKWSYDSLQGENIKPCFLYCCLYPEDYSIEVSELINCWMGEGLVYEQDSYEDTYNRGIALIENLKDSCLLEEGARKGTVKMHDVVRDVAIWISHVVEDGCKSLVKSGINLTRISRAEMLESLKRVSLMHNRLAELPQSGICCPKASSVLLQGNLSLGEIPDGFLQAFPSANVLNLSNTGIRSLPESIVQLVDLKVLLLRGYDLEELTLLHMLSKLLVLDCCDTAIRELPHSMKIMSNLRQLYLSRTIFLKTIKEGTISGLSNLEVLDMTGSAYIWSVKQGEATQAQACFRELLRLDCLLVLSISLQQLPILGSEEQPWISKLRRFQFVIGPHQPDRWQTERDSKRVVISGGHHGSVMSHPFVANAASLVLDSCIHAQTIIDRPNKPFTGLKSLTISNSQISDMITSLRVPRSKTDLLPNLEELRLAGIKDIISITGLVRTLNLRLTRLRVIKVTRCPALRYLLQYGELEFNTEKLEAIKVSYCDNLQELFRHPPGETKASSSVVPNLRLIDVKNCNSLGKLPLRDLNPDTIQEIRGDKDWWNKLEQESDEQDTKIHLQHFFKPVAQPKFQLPPPTTSSRPQIRKPTTTTDTNTGKFALYTIFKCDLI